MGARVHLARFLLRLGRFIQSLPVAVLRPDDLIEFSRQTYADPARVESWAEDALMEDGLTEEERELLSSLPSTQGHLLLLGLGGGREAIPFARMGFRVTGVDYVPELVRRAKENAIRRGVQIEGLVQEISCLDVPAASCDVVWLSREMYSVVPTRARRVEMVRRIARALRPGGWFLCQFHWAGGLRHTRGSIARRIIGVCTLGNRHYEEGDMLWQNIEFVHAFRSLDHLRAELEEGGVAVVGMKTQRGGFRGQAVCRVLPGSVIGLARR